MISHQPCLIVHKDDEVGNTEEQFRRHPEVAGRRTTKQQLCLHSSGDAGSGGGGGGRGHSGGGDVHADGQCPLGARTTPISFHTRYELTGAWEGSTYWKQQLMFLNSVNFGGVL